MDMKPRNWVPDVETIPEQLIADYRSANGERQGHLDAIGTMDSWQGTAHVHGEEFTEDDWIALVCELARRAAYQIGD
jgi:hypothetical protein